jgi:hypothetical protein
LGEEEHQQSQETAVWWVWLSSNYCDRVTHTKQY